MKAKKLFFLVGLIFIVVLPGGCFREPQTQETEIGDLEVHEWGVLVGCKSDDSYFLTSRPEELLLVKQPVIYIHSKDKKPFDVRVTFKDGKPTFTHPEAKVKENIVSWENVDILEEILKGATKEKMLAPIEMMLEALNNVDADWLEYNGKKSRFLFYEGELRFKNRVEASYDFEKSEATFKNNGSYPIFNLVLIASKEGNQILEPPEIYLSRVEKLNPHEEMKASLIKRDVDDLISGEESLLFQEDLTRLGFTEKEAESFNAFWRRPFLYRSNVGGWVNLVYRLSEKEYNQMIALEIKPQPKKVLRALYVLVHLEELEGI